MNTNTTGPENPGREQQANISTSVSSEETVSTNTAANCDVNNNLILLDDSKTVGKRSNTLTSLIFLVSDSSPINIYLCCVSPQEILIAVLQQQHAFSDESRVMLFSSPPNSRFPQCRTHDFMHHKPKLVYINYTA